MTVLIKNNINPLMQQSVQYFLLSHLSQHKQSGWFESTPRIIVRVKNMICSNLSHRQTSFGLETY
jgi:hypothetical protein